MTDTVTTKMLRLPRPNTSTTSGVSATSGMDWLTSASGSSVRPRLRHTVVATANASATASPANIPSSVMGRVSPRASHKLSRLSAAASLVNTCSKTPCGPRRTISDTPSDSKSPMTANHNTKGMASAPARKNQRYSADSASGPA